MSKNIKVNVDLEFIVRDEDNFNRDDLDLRGLDEAYIESIGMSPYVCSERIVYHTVKVNSVMEE